MFGKSEFKLIFLISFWVYIFNVFVHWNINPGTWGTYDRIGALMMVIVIRSGLWVFCVETNRSKKIKGGE